MPIRLPKRESVIRAVRQSTWVLIFLVGLLPLAYNSCQDQGFRSYTGGSKGKQCTSQKLAEKSLRGSSNVGMSPSAFAKSKLRLKQSLKNQGSLAPASFQSKTSAFSGESEDRLLLAGQEFGLMIDTKCMTQRLSEGTYSPLDISFESIGKGQSIPEVPLYTASFILQKDIMSTQLERRLDQDPCAIGMAKSQKYFPASVSIRDDWSVEQDHLRELQAEASWKEFFHSDYGMNPASTDKDVIIAIVDSGADTNHPDLVNVLWESPEGWNGIDAASIQKGKKTRYLVNDIDPGFKGYGGHGTHVAGLAAAQTGNNYYVAGLAPARVKLMIVRAFQIEQVDGQPVMTTNSTTVANGIAWAVENGARVINLSFSSATEGPADDPLLEEAINAAVKNGAFVVGVIGNGSAEQPARLVDGKNFSVTPGVYAKNINGFMAVGSYDIKNQEISDFSNWSSEYVEIMAPGAFDSKDTNFETGVHTGGLYSILPKDERSMNTGRGWLMGTSQAAPLVAAGAALVMGAYQQHFDELPSPAQVEKIIKGGAIRTSALRPYALNGGKFDLLSTAQRLHVVYPEISGEYPANVNPCR